MAKRLTVKEALTQAKNRNLSADDIKETIRQSEGERSDANKAKGHALQHAQDAPTARTVAYSDNRGYHSAFKSDDQQAEIVQLILQTLPGVDALQYLHDNGARSSKLSHRGAEGANMVVQGNIGGRGEFAFNIFDEVDAEGVVIEVQSADGKLHVRSAYPLEDASGLTGRMPKAEASLEMGLRGSPVSNGVRYYEFKDAYWK